MNEKCIRCGKETEYDINTPITVRRYFVEGSGQLCEKCFHILYLVSGPLQCKLGLDNISPNAAAAKKPENNNLPGEKND